MYAGCGLSTGRHYVRVVYDIRRPPQICDRIYGADVGVLRETSSGFLNRIILPSLDLPNRMDFLKFSDTTDKGENDCRVLEPGSLFLFPFFSLFKNFSSRYRFLNKKKKTKKKNSSKMTKNRRDNNRSFPSKVPIFDCLETRR